MTLCLTCVTAAPAMTRWRDLTPNAAKGENCFLAPDVLTVTSSSRYARSLVFYLEVRLCFVPAEWFESCVLVQRISVPLEAAEPQVPAMRRERESLGSCRLPTG